MSAGRSERACSEAKESIELAFIAALEQLPGRQHAVLLLCDVLGWSAQEVASMLAISVTPTHSVLQRARAGIGRPVEARAARLSPAAERVLAARYLRAWEVGDVDALVSLLKAARRASGSPGFVIYAREQPFGLQVVEADARGITALTSFMNPKLFDFFDTQAPAASEAASI